MNETTDLLHVARPRECNVQQLGASSATVQATTCATTSLKAAALLVIARNRACNNRATRLVSGVQQTPARTSALVASESALTSLLGELNGLVARLSRYPELSSVDVAQAHEVATRNVSEALRSLRTPAEAVQEPALPIGLVMDDRITCRQCAKHIGEICRVKASPTVLDQARRCRSFEPRAEEDDQRTGQERWQWLHEIGR